MPVKRGSRLVCGVGVNDADYTVFRGGKPSWTCEYYSRWRGMLHRCYSSKTHAKRPSYKECSVSDDWKSFSNFKSWMEKQDWKDKDLDKDLIKMGNKVYSVDTCVFVDRSVNIFIQKSEGTRGEFPLGVYYHKGRKKFVAKISKGKTKLFLGDHLSETSAHRAWQIAKINYGKELMGTQSDERVLKGIKRIIDKIQSDYDNNRETITF